MPSRKPKPAPPIVTERTGKVGKPPYVPTDKDRLTVKVMVAGGILHTAIAGVLGISHVTLRKHFRREIDNGKAEVDAQVVASLITMAVGQKPAPGRQAIAPNHHSAKWYTQARMGWMERIAVVDGGTEVDPTTLTDEQIAERLAKLKRTGAVVRASKAQGTVH